MTFIGIDLEQFIRDPYATGIQRVMQQLAVHWPSSVGAEFVIPNDDGSFTLLTPAQAAELLTLPFTSHKAVAAGHDANHDLRMQVSAAMRGYLDDRSIPSVSLGELVSIFDGWLLPEVSYLPSVLQRLDIFSQCMPVTMIGYDALPMTEPANYRFVPGRGADVSEYFRRLATVDSVVCISEYSRGVILDALRRDRRLRTTVAHPGGDHLPIRPLVGGSLDRGSARVGSGLGDSGGPPRFIRLGTMEARKRPLEILRGFRAAVDAGLVAELVFIGNPNASAQAINDEVIAAIAAGYPVEWVRGASDAEVYDLVAGGDAFLSIGVEGYGIPVLEAIRLGTPVVYDGIQPAGELMEGRGARRMPALSEADLSSMFLECASGGLDAVRRELDPDAVPTWAAFASAVAERSAPA